MKRSKNRGGFAISEKVAKCNFCDKTFLTKRAYASNLWAHLHANHVLQYIKQRMKQNILPPPSTPEFRLAFAKPQSYATNFQKYKERTEAVLDYIVSADSHNPSSKNMLAKLDSRYKPPSRRTVTDDWVSAK